MKFDFLENKIVETFDGDKFEIQDVSMTDYLTKELYMDVEGVNVDQSVGFSIYYLNEDKLEKVLKDEDTL